VRGGKNIKTNADSFFVPLLLWGALAMVTELDGGREEVMPKTTISIRKVLAKPSFALWLRDKSRI
jgi:hypothetical protein